MEQFARNIFIKFAGGSDEVASNITGFSGVFKEFIDHYYCYFIFFFFEPKAATQVLMLRQGKDLCQVLIYVDFFWTGII